MSFAVAGTIAAAAAVYKGAHGVAKAVDGAQKAKKAKEEAARAKKEYEQNKAMFASLDTSNPYLNMENTMEDLTVNQKEAEFMKQQQTQQQANVMQQMRGAAGGSGIAALAQAMAGQGSLDAQRAAASIGQQEASNQRARASEASRLQGMERQGEVYSRGQEQAKVTKLMGLSQQELATAKAERRAAEAQIHEGIASVGDAAVDYATGELGPVMGGKQDVLDDAGNVTGQQRQYYNPGGGGSSSQKNKMAELAEILNDEEKMKELGYGKL
tara:strand:+ start:4906 stop:5715 length:810 start_codon:yes stop_codon:yes gene_type:complete